MEVLATRIGQHDVGTAPILRGFGARNESRPLQPIDEPTGAAVAEHALRGDRLNAQPPLRVEEEPQEHFVLGVAQAPGTTEVLLEAGEQAAVRRDETSPSSGFCRTEHRTHRMRERQASLVIYSMCVRMHLLKKLNMSNESTRRIPLWVNLMQAVLILIMVVQVFENFFNHDALVSAGLGVTGDPQLNFIYEMGSRLFVMVVASVFVMVTQNPRQYLVVLVMNVVRESFEGIIDPLWPVADAPAPPWVDFAIHVAIVAIELAALITVWKIAKNEDAAAAPAIA